MIETQTGYQLRSPEQQIDRAALLDSLKAVYNVGDKERAAAVVREPLYSFLDPGRAGAVGSRVDKNRRVGAPRSG